MERDYFWLSERQFAPLEPHLPTDTRGKPRVDDRRVISGIIHVLKSSARWVDVLCPWLSSIRSHSRWSKLAHQRRVGNERSADLVWVAQSIVRCGECGGECERRWL